MKNKNFERIIYYPRVLATFARLSLMTVFEYRLSGLLILVRSFLSFLVVVGFFEIIFGKTGQIGGWDKPQIFLFYGVFLLADTVFDMFLQGDLFRLGEYVEEGTLDLVLSKPSHPLFLLTFRRIKIFNVFNIILSFLVINAAANSLKIVFSPFTALFFFVLLLSGVVIYYCLYAIVATFSFWTTRTPYFELLETVSGIARYPLDIFGKSWQIFFTFLVPMIFYVTVPVKFLLGAVDWLAAVSPLVAAFFLFLVLRFWRFAVRSYSGAGS